MCALAHLFYPLDVGGGHCLRYNIRNRRERRATWTDRVLQAKYDATIQKGFKRARRSKSRIRMALAPPLGPELDVVWSDRPSFDQIEAPLGGGRHSSGHAPRTGVHLDRRLFADFTMFRPRRHAVARTSWTSGQGRPPCTRLQVGCLVHVDWEGTGKPPGFGAARRISIDCLAASID